MGEKAQKEFKLYKIFVYVALIALAVSIIVPVAWVCLASLKSHHELVSGNPFSMPAELLWVNFVAAFQKAKMGSYLLNTVFVTALSLIFLLVLALPASYVLARFKFKGRGFFNLFFMAGLFVNVSYIVLPIYLMLFETELALGIANMNILTNNKIVLALIYASTALPFTIYLLRSYFATLPKAYEEAAYIDGCGHFKTMLKIMIPMARPSIITVILFQFLAFWNEYILAFTLLNKEDATLAVGLKYLMANQRQAGDYGVMYAGLVIVMLPTLILYILVQKQLTQGMSLGGLKD